MNGIMQAVKPAFADQGRLHHSSSGAYVQQGSCQNTKSLKVSVTKVALTEAGSGWAFRCTVNFNIEMSDGQIATLVADDTSWKYLNACDGVIPKVVLAALRDERVLKFLANP